MAAMKSVEDLLVGEIKDLYSAEKQLTKAIPKMVAGANDADLKAGLEEHLAQTKEQASRLEKVAEILKTKASGKTCKAMEGLIAEGEEALESDSMSPLQDLAIIGAARRVEHYEMAGYLTAIDLAEALGQDDVVAILNESLQEEQNQEDALKEMTARIIEEAQSTTERKPASSSSATHKTKARTASA